MSVAESFDYGALHWVKGEIDLTMRQARRALELFSEHRTDTTPVRQCINGLHQAHGALLMLDLPGAMMFSHELEQLTSAIYNNAVKDVNAALDTLMRGVLQLPEYLDSLINGQRDNALLVLDMINELRHHRGAEPYREHEVFDPNIVDVAPLRPIVRAENIRDLALRLRPAFQTNLLAWLKNSEDIAALERMIEASDALQLNALTDTTARLWWITSAVCTTLRDEYKNIPLDVKRALAKVERSLKRLIDSGEWAVDDDFTLRLTKSLLYFVGKSSARDDRVLEIRAAFNLDRFLPRPSGDMSGPSAATYFVTAGAIKEELQRVKETLSDLAKNHLVDNAALLASVDLLRRIADTLTVLEWEEARKLIREQADHLEAMARSDAPIDDKLLMNVAQGILSAESLLSPSAHEPPSERERLSPAEYQELCRNVVREIMVDMAKIKDDIMAFSKAPDKAETIMYVPSLLHRIIGSVSMLSLPRPVALLKAVQYYMAKDLLEKNITPQQIQIDALADTLTCVEYYMETLAESQLDLDTMLELAERSVIILGYSVEDIEHVQPISFVTPQESDPPKQAAAESLDKTPQEIADPLRASTSSASMAAAVDDLADVADVFAEEAAEELAVINEFLPRWRNDLENQDVLSRIRRSFHTLKGSGRLVGARIVGEVAWAMENLLNRVLEKERRPHFAMTDIVGDAAALIPQILQDFREHGETQELSPKVQNLINRATALANGEMPLPLMMPTEKTLSSPSSAAPPAIDPVLLEIFRKESAGRLVDVNTFIDACRRDQTGRVTEALLRTLHTIHGSAHMAGFSDIAELSALFERHAYSLSASNDGQMSEVDLMALKDFSQLIDSMLPLLDEAVSDQGDIQEKVAVLSRLQQHLIHQVEHRNISSEGGSGEMVAGKSSDAADEIVQIFLEEAVEILDSTERNLHLWLENPDNTDAVADLERELHTFKGGARMAGLLAMGNLSHSIESLLQGVVAGRISPTTEVSQTLQISHDTLQHMLERAMARQPVQHAPALIATLEALANPERALHQAVDTAAHVEEPPAAVMETEVSSTVLETLDSETTESAPQSTGTPEPSWVKQNSAEQIRVRADLLENIINNAGELSILRTRLDQQVNGFRSGLGEMKQTVTRLRDQLRKLEIETEAQILFRHHEATLSGHSFDPLELDRFSLVQQLSRALLETAADLSSIQDILDKQSGDSINLLLQQGRLNTELQEELMRTRMVPFTGAAARLKRVIRQTSRELKKQVEFSVIGERIEVDRTVLDRIMGPLEHIVRNAVDHAIEDPMTRQAVGKSETGHIQIQLNREGNELAIRIRDDGRGLDFEAVRRKAIERGMMSAEADVPTEHLIQFILEPGFSTAQQVTQISGRGVGLDVVSSEIKQLGGSLHIGTEPGQGSVFTIHLPLTLSITQALIVVEGDQLYAIPQGSIEAVARISHAEIEAAAALTVPELTYGNEKYRLLDLTMLLHDVPLRIPEGRKRHIVLLLRSSIGQQRIALRVDEYSESREIVVKALGIQLASVRGVSGATIMGDGRVVLILDLSALVRRMMIGGQTLAPVADSTPVPAAEAPTEQRLLTVMVVDDSITVRKVTSRFLQRHNMNVITAKDGIDALAQLQNHIPDVMLLDIEMPRMDGYELTTTLRNDERLKNIPIIMITSRTGDKHRNHALAIGVNRYMGKPYQDAALLRAIAELSQLNNSVAQKG